MSDIDRILGRLEAMAEHQDKRLDRIETKLDCVCSEQAAARALAGSKPRKVINWKIGLGGLGGAIVALIAMIKGVK